MKMIEENKRRRRKEIKEKKGRNKKMKKESGRTHTHVAGQIRLQAWRMRYTHPEKKRRPAQCAGCAEGKWRARVAHARAEEDLLLLLTSRVPRTNLSWFL
ncbi:hypothetical protein [Candidatus Burkholderia verschuerenii]|uniref:hypothetical protein n=1 Tax=Candidatus Burkholderia verschuerenii TaxID=242163 RepID=UPI000A6FCDE5|nr:hypothetical protein [Candidatus Burkholderia verschuerenii]